MINFFITVILVALISAFFICLANKWHIIEDVQIHGGRFFSEMFNCNYCLSWWTGCIISLIWAAASGDASVLFVPFFSTMITRYIL